MPVLGWPHDLKASDTVRRAHLSERGLAIDVIDFFLHYVSVKGTIMEQWRSNVKASRLVNALHTKSWFQYGDNAGAVATYLGGRQGYKLGFLIFNALYALAIISFKENLKNLGLMARVTTCSDPLNGACSHSSTADIVDIFVSMAYVLFCFPGMPLFCVGRSILDF